MPLTPATTQAAILVAQKKPLVVDTIELPPSLEAGQVLVKVERSGICGSQLGEIDGVKGEDPYLPHLLGHEGFGSVLDIGPGVRHVQVNDKVVLHWKQGAGIESETPKYRWRGKTVNAGWITTFNNHAVISENRCTKVPADTDPDTAALFGCAVTTGIGVVENDARIKPGETVVVFGAGGIGLNIIQAAAMVSACPIIAIDKYQSRLDLAKQCGATHGINSSEIDAEANIIKTLDTEELDVFIDNTGNPGIIELGYRLIQKKGRLVLVGVPRSKDNVSLNTLPIHLGKQLIGSHGGAIIPDRDIHRYLKLQRAGKIKLKNLITKKCRLDEVNDAIRSMRAGEINGRVIIQF